MGALPSRLPLLNELDTDQTMAFGAEQDALLYWASIDANANLFMLVMPEGGAVKVPVFAVGDSTAYNKDLGLFNGVTDPTFAILSDDATKYLSFSHDGTDSHISSNSGFIEFNAGSNNIKLPDDNGFIYGSGNDVTLIYETADTNANAFVCALPEGGATNVPVFAVGDKSTPSVVNADLSFFNGVTDPTLALVSSDNTKYGSFSHDGTDFIYYNSSGVHRFKGTSVVLNGTISLSFNDTADYGLRYGSIGGVDSLILRQGSASSLYFSDSLLAQADLAFANDLNALEQFIHTKSGGTSTTGNGYNGGNLYFRVGDGSDAYASEGGDGGDGGNFIVETGISGAGDGGGSSGEEGALIVRLGGGVAGTDEIQLLHNGTDGNIIAKSGDIFLDCTNVKFGTYTGTPATDSTGYITIKDAAGNTRKVMIQA